MARNFQELRDRMSPDRRAKNQQAVREELTQILLEETGGWKSSPTCPTASASRSASFAGPSRPPSNSAKRLRGKPRALMGHKTGWA